MVVLVLVNEALQASVCVCNLAALANKVLLFARQLIDYLITVKKSHKNYAVVVQLHCDQLAELQILA